MNISLFKTLAALSLLAVLLTPAFADESSSPAAGARQPNIVFIMADDLGYGDVSCYGQKKFSTPRIDSLAQQGMKFTQMYAGTTVCAPSRCCLMTGVHSGHAYIRGNMAAKPFGDSPIPADAVTLTRVLKDAGYSVGVFGKWGLGAVGNCGDPNKHGVDRFFGYYSQLEAHNYYPPRLHDNGFQIDLDGKTYSHDLIVIKALEFIRANKDKPFFCFMPVTIPHAAMQVPEPYMTPWREKFPQFEKVLGRYTYKTVVRNPVAAFPAMVTRLDDTVGQVLDLLKELGLEEDTIVIFTSDNGPHHEGGHRPDFFNSSGAVRGLKRDLYDGGIREPFVIQWKGKIQPGSVTEHVAAFWDILPTFAELTGAKTPDNLDGISLVPTLLGDPDSQKSHEYLYWEFHEMGGKRAIRFGDFKAVQNDMNKKPRGKIEIYNIVKDPKELNNLADERPDLVQKARKILNSARTSNPIWNWAP
ncbi:MAG: arylsulfatase [Thermoguttaceae bacterium]|nr:arylsulfatase [Thermoguttaceae bacterium]